MPGRFAAKEAAIKAHHSRRLTFQDISILSTSNPNLDTGSKAPVAVVVPSNGNYEDGQEIRVSISHDGDYATAVCMAFDPAV
jgi:holo-[acyl-carrier protein] synthase